MQSPKKSASFHKPSPVSQSAARETDINRMIDAANRYNSPLPSGSRPPVFGDFTMQDFQAAQDLIVDTKQRFSMLPSRVRAAFDNSPIQLVRAFELSKTDDRIRDRLVDLGLLDKPVPPPAPEPAPLRADPEAQPFTKPEG